MLVILDVDVVASEVQMPGHEKLHVSPDSSFCDRLTDC